ncbi:MAG: hypothetical protein ABI605_14635 [Rhizobacter sp.]
MTDHEGFALHGSQHNGFTISTERKRLDLAAIQAHLTRSYWAEGISLALVTKSVSGSPCFGLYQAPTS